MSRQGVLCEAGQTPAPLGLEAGRLAQELRRNVEHLAGTIGERNLRRYRNLVLAATMLEETFLAAGYAVRKLDYTVEGDGRPVWNVEAQRRGAERAQEIVVIGAHYDSVEPSPGANDNATGLAAMLALARACAGRRLARTVRFVAFVNEEPPHFQTPAMGSWVYAQGCRQQRERIVAMLSLETIGYYTRQPNTQQYPWPFARWYPSTGHFIGFVSNLSSAWLLRRVVRAFRRVSGFPCESIALPSIVPGVGWSDHWAFWDAGYRAVMVTDTAPFRYPHYHTAMDTPNKVCYDDLAQVVIGLGGVVVDLAGRPCRVEAVSDFTYNAG
jgi:hypothetical protein